MPTATDFLTEIARHPHNLDRRAIYADWLEEQGTDPERVEFIRVQLEVSERHDECARLGSSIGVESAAYKIALSRYDALRRRETEMLVTMIV